MADVLPTPSHMSIDTIREGGPPAPLPNPPFAFPVQHDSFGEMNARDNAPSSMGTVSSQRPGPRSRPQHMSLSALPAFDFSPASSKHTKTSHSPSRSPSRRTPPISYAGGHRRNGSEYVGGGITTGGPVLVSSSPTKSEHPSGHCRNGSEVIGGATTNTNPDLVHNNHTEGDALSNSQPNVRLGPPAARRGHAHRRSGAISSHDISMILKPSSETKAGSAPSTPSDPIFQSVPAPKLDRSTSQPVLSTTAPESPPPPAQQEIANADGQARPRLRFAEKIDYISRPLSTISSETSSSMSTIRANHSVSNSISSVVSTNTSSGLSNIYQTLRRGQTLQGLENEQAKPRPKTAEARSRPSPEDFEWDFSDAGTTTQRPSSAPSGDSPSKVKETPSNVPSGHSSTSTKRAFSDLFVKPAQTIPSSPRNVNSQLPRRRPVSPTVRPRTSPEPKVTKRQHKGRSWAGLLSRKEKHPDFKREVKKRRSPTPPLRQPSPEMGLSFDDINFDEETTYFIDNESDYSSRPSKPQHTAWKPRESSPLSETDNSASVLDIDAALGSFETSSSGPSFDEVVGGGLSSAVKRPMHSSGATGGFVGPGMHYHRRADSAPELDADDRSRFGFPRLGSNPAMAIEEEEEEEDEEDDRKSSSNQADAAGQRKGNDGKEEQAPGLGVNVVEADTAGNQPIQRARRRPAKDARQKQEDHDQFNTVEIVGADEEPRFSMITKSSDESTITPTLSTDPLDTFHPPAPASLAMPPPALTYGTPDTPLNFTSPDFARASFDAPRVHTATSSITDRTTLNSLRAGDQGLGLHGSIDDVPSLTSSASTMSAHPPRFSSSANSAADRSSSLSAAVPARTRPVSAHKRLSLASLSRLAGSSYNKSKLNIEETAPIETTERTEKKKRNRISRMMKFWKSKEKLSAS